MAVYAAANALSGALGSGVAMGFLFPLEHVRMRLQVQYREKKNTNPDGHVAANTDQSQHERRTRPRGGTVEGRHTHYRSALDCAMTIIQKEGWQTLYRGLRSSLVGVMTSSTVYFFLYSLAKRLYLQYTKQRQLSALANGIIACVAGALNALCTVPLWVVNTRLTLADSTDGIIDTAKRIYTTEGLAGLYHGLGPALALVSNPAIQFVCYEQSTKWFSYVRMRQLGKSHLVKLTTTEYFLLGAFAKAIATLFTYPLQVLKSRLQSKDFDYKGPIDAVLTMWKHEGFGAFWQGWVLR